MKSHSCPWRWRMELPVNAKSNSPLKWRWVVLDETRGWCDSGCNAHTHTHAHTHTRTHTHTHAHTHTHTHAHTHTHTHTHARTHAHTHACTHAHTHARTHTHAHTHTQQRLGLNQPGFKSQLTHLLIVILGKSFNLSKLVTSSDGILGSLLKVVIRWE